MRNPYPEDKEKSYGGEKILVKWFYDREGNAVACTPANTRPYEVIGFDLKKATK